MDAKPLAWQDLQVFLAVARSGTLLGAAHTLDSSAATVLRKLRLLERSLNTGLFVRSSRGYTLTPAGRELLGHVQAIEAEVLAAERRLGGRDQRLTGTLRIATLDDLVQAVLGPILLDFSQRHPAVCLDLVIDDGFTDLARRSADVAIRAGSPPAAPDVIARKVCFLGVALYASRGYLRHCVVPPSLATLPAQRVVRADAARAALPMEKVLDHLAAGATTVLRSHSMLVRVAAVRNGLGVGFLPCFIADAEPELVRLGEVVEEASATVWILIHPDLRRNARVRAFVEHVHAELLRLERRFAGEAPSG